MVVVIVVVVVVVVEIVGVVLNNILPRYNVLLRNHEVAVHLLILL